MDDKLLNQNSQLMNEADSSRLIKEMGMEITDLFPSWALRSPPLMPRSNPGQYFAYSIEIEYRKIKVFHTLFSSQLRQLPVRTYALSQFIFWGRRDEESREHTARITTVQTPTVAKNTTWSWLQQLRSSQLGLISPQLSNLDPPSQKLLALSLQASGLPTKVQDSPTNKNVRGERWGGERERVQGPLGFEIGVLIFIGCWDSQYRTKQKRRSSSGNPLFTFLLLIYHFIFLRKHFRIKR